MNQFNARSSVLLLDAWRKLERKPLSNKLHEDQIWLNLLGGRSGGTPIREGYAYDSLLDEEEIRMTKARGEEVFTS